MELVSALGSCPVHRIDKMSVTDGSGNTELVCVKCRAAGEIKTGRTQIVEDPGEAFNGFSGGKGKVTLLDAQYDASAKAAAPIGRRPVVASAGLTLEEIVERAVSELGNLPMPKDIKQFKKVQKVIKTLQSLVENQNG